MQEFDFAADELAAQRCRDVLQCDVSGSDTDSKRIADKQHEHFVDVRHLLEVLRVAGEREGALLHGVLVNGGRYEDVHFRAGQRLNRSVQKLTSVLVSAVNLTGAQSFKKVTIALAIFSVSSSFYFLALFISPSLFVSSFFSVAVSLPLCIHVSLSLDLFVCMRLCLSVLLLFCL